MKVLLVDDHPLILSALQVVIEGLGDDVTVVGVDRASDGYKVLQRESDFDLVLLDLSLGEENGFEVLGTLRRRYPALPVVVVSATERIADVVHAIDMGAMGFVPKRSSNVELRGALAVVMGGGVYIPPSMLGLVRMPEPPEGGDTVPSVMRPSPETAEAGIDRPAKGFETLGLTPRQAEVLALLLRGLPNKLIARELGVSVETVKDHVAAVLRALGVSSRTQAVLAVSQMTMGEQGLPGWQPPPR